jgi:sporulation related protein
LRKPFFNLYTFVYPIQTVKTPVSIALSLFLSLAYISAYSQAKDTSAVVFTASAVTAVTPNLIYRVQIATVKNKSEVASILKRYKITDEPFLENENTSIIKAMIGSYPNYSSAKKRVDELKSKGLKAAFVAPYYKGNRVSLQEAAMHSQE